MKHLFSCLLLAVAFAACNNDDGSDQKSLNNPYVPIQISSSEAKIVTQGNSFAYRLFDAYNEQESKLTQYVISPLSASYALSMLANGAAGNTQAEILNALGIGQMSMSDANALHQRMMERLGSMDKTAQVKIANMMWMNPTFKPLDTYKQTLQTNYAADLMQNSAVTAVPVINKWCADKTNGLIGDLLNPGDLGPETRMMLLNALYFKGMWSSPFDRKLTAKETFHNADRTQSTVDMMNATGDYRYYEGKHFTLAELPYGNGAFYSQFILPAKDVSLDDCIKEFVTTNWDEVDAGGSLMKLQLKMPKFKIEVNKQLNEVMQALGINGAFLPSADFSNLSDEPLLVGSIIQAATFAVDEESTKAAAVTGVIMVTSAGPIVSTKNFYLDRPFLFLLRERSTGAILFMGKVAKL